MEKNPILSQSKDMSNEYCATVVRLDQVTPMENSDFLGVTVVEGREIVVRKDTVHEGNVMIYICNECQLNAQFLSVNNEFQETKYNANRDWLASQIKLLQQSGATEAEVQQFATQNSGYFGKNCRVRMKKLRGVMSMGYLIHPEMMTVFNKKCASINWEELVGERFDTVDGELFVQPYMPEVSAQPQVRGNKRNKRLKKFSRIVPGQFSFHYDTQQLQTNMSVLRPWTWINISVKLHGTSSIIGNILVKKPKWGGLYNRFFNWFPACLQKTVTVYDDVCSSRNVIINGELYDGKVNENVDGAEQREIKRWKERLAGFIPHNITVYGEIVGYFEDSSTGIMSLGGKVFDYGNPVGKNQLMIYRVSEKLEDSTTEYNPDAIAQFVSDLKVELTKAGKDKIAERLRPLDVLYDGQVAGLYPDLPTSDDFLKLIEERPEVPGESEEDKAAREKFNTIIRAERAYMYDWMSVEKKTINDFLNEKVSRDSKIYKAWQTALLQRLKNDKNFCMEMDEPLCVNKLPREGIVVRIYDDPIAEAFKLKTVRFLHKEAEDVDKGKVDSESQARYQQ